MTSANRHRDVIEALRRAVLGTPGDTTVSVRAAAATGGDLPEPLGSYAAKVREHSYRITDGDIAALKAAGHSEDAILEITLAAALGAAWQRYLRGMAALDEDA